MLHVQLKRKTADLNKACEKHYQLEQELAFYKIDSKFQSLGEAPPPQQDLVSLCVCVCVCVCLLVSVCVCVCVCW